MEKRRDKNTLLKAQLRKDNTAKINEKQDQDDDNMQYDISLKNKPEIIFTEVVIKEERTDFFQEIDENDEPLEIFDCHTEIKEENLEITNQNAIYPVIDIEHITIKTEPKNEDPVISPEPEDVNEMSVSNIEHLNIKEEFENIETAPLLGDTVKIINVNDLFQNGETNNAATSTANENIGKENKKDSRIDSNARPFTCLVCNKVFSKRVILITHERIHTGEKPYKCNVCNKAFVQKFTLTRHERIHTGEKPHKCNVCNKVFAQRANLTTHEKIHSGEKPYKCNLCNKAFISSSGFTKHRRIHTGEKPYECNVCNKAFTSSSDLTIHERIHSGKKPYKCNVCNKAFGRSSYLTRHIRIHAGKNLTNVTHAIKYSTDEIL